MYIKWQLTSPYRFNPVYYKHQFSTNLYRIDGNQLTLFKLSTGARSRFRVIYTNVPYICDSSFAPSDFFPVDSRGLSILGDWPNTVTYYDPTPAHTSLEHFCHTVIPILQQICGNITFPPDHGSTLIQSIRNKSSNIFGASDASLKHGRASHSWIISSGDVDDILDPMLHISGSGPVHGLPQYLLSSSGELQCITAVSLMAKLLMDYHSYNCKVRAICDNSGMISKCSRPSRNSLKSQRIANLDLFLTQADASKEFDLKLEWIGSHSDKSSWKDLDHLKKTKSINR
jgi:hypothetical protein